MSNQNWQDVALHRAAEIADLRTMLDGERRTSRDALAELASMTSLCDRLAAARDAALARVGVLEAALNEVLLRAEDRDLYQYDVPKLMLQMACRDARAVLAPRSERREGESQREVQLSSRAAFFVGMAEAARMVESQDVSGLDPAVKVARDAFAECIRVRATALESLAPAAPKEE